MHYHGRSSSSSSSSKNINLSSQDNLIHLLSNLTFNSNLSSSQRSQDNSLLPLYSTPITSSSTSTALNSEITTFPSSLSTVATPELIEMSPIQYHTHPGLFQISEDDSIESSITFTDPIAFRTRSSRL